MNNIFLLFCFGIILSAYFPSLPSLTYFIPCIAICFLLIFFAKKLSHNMIFAAFIAGICYGIASGYYSLGNQLADELAGQDLIVEGKVVDLPKEDGRRQTFSFLVTNAYANKIDADAFNSFPKKINLSSFSSLRVKTGEQWRLLVKLKKPRGFVNPGGFDYQASLLRRGVGATGYIREDSGNQIIQPQPTFSMDVLRYQLQQWLLEKSHSPEKGILVALLVGDTSLVDKQQWGEMQKTGTNHLIAISGLHLGFFAIVGFFLGNFMGRFVQLFWRACPSMVVGYFFAITFTVFYSVIAGLNIPTLRTLIMLAVVQWVLVWRRNFRGRDTLLLALVLVLLYDPLAVFDIGFWLSFGAVGMLIFCFSGRIRAKNKIRASIPFANFFIEFIKSQWVMFIGLLIPLAVLVHSSALLAPPANFIAIPLVTFFVVPCLILAALCHLVFVGSTAAEAIFLHCAELGLSWLHQWLQYLLGLGSAQLTPLVNFNSWSIIVAVLSVLLILLPRGLSNKWIGICGLIVALLVPLKTAPALQMLVFDVGQGTAILLRTPHHQLLYDTGPLYTENFDAGSALVVPYLQSQGLRKLDKVVVSHNDRDHVGGLAGVLSATQVDQLLLGEPEKYHPTDTALSGSSIALNASQISECHHVKPWQWDEVTFRFINWPISPSAKANNHSCVLMVEYQGHKILLAGDIEKEAESSLLAHNSIEHVDILLAPHHGSRTSSTQSFVEKIQPNTVIYSAGYHNQFGHPHKDVKARYSLIGARQMNTAFSGALEFNWDAGVLSSQYEYRTFSQRYWFDGDTQ